MGNIGFIPTKKEARAIFTKANELHTRHMRIVGKGFKRAGKLNRTEHKKIDSIRYARRMLFSGHHEKLGLLGRILYAKELESY
mgnify:CR=1 FL=1